MRPQLSLAVVALLGAAARPAAAQRAAADLARPVVALADSTAATGTRPVAAYRFAISARAAGLPDQVTVADSSGVLVASYRAPGTAAERPLAVEVLDTDLVLQGETPTGLLTLRLFGQNAAAPGTAIDGRWWLGAREGALRGRVTR